MLDERVLRFLTHKRHALNFLRFLRIRCGMRSEISESLRDFGDFNSAQLSAAPSRIHYRTDLCGIFLGRLPFLRWPIS